MTSPFSKPAMRSGTDAECPRGIPSNTGAAQALPQLQESIGRLHFAGDHTSATAGTHGAYNKARRVANRIRNANPIGR